MILIEILTGLVLFMLLSTLHTEAKQNAEVNKIIGSTENVRIITQNGNDVNFAAEGQGDAIIISGGGNDFNNATFNQGNVIIISGSGNDDNLVGLNHGYTVLRSGPGDDQNLVSRNLGKTLINSGAGNDHNTFSDETSKGSEIDCGSGQDQVTLVGNSDPSISDNCETVQRIN